MISLNTHEVDIFKNDWFLLPDMFNFICGKPLGSGQYRTVYEFQIDPSYVIKVERFNEVPEISFNNITEFELWTNIKHHHKQYAKFLAPCTRVSDCGRLLLQKKTTPVIEKEMPKNIPWFLTDTKIENWGRLDNKVVCHDYANHRLYSQMPKNKLVKAKWIK